VSWQGILGHDDVVERFRRSLARGRLATTFLFVGVPGIGKRIFAERLAAALLCHVRPAEAMDPCGACPSCVQVAAGTHPDLLYVARPEGKSFIPVSLLIGTKERRMQEGLCHDISLKPFMGGRRIAIVDDADYLNDEGANCLLKTLEEPPPRSVMILIGTSADRQLPTIRSRCQTVRFRPLKTEIVERLLLETGTLADPAEAGRLARFSDGSLERAVELSDPALWAFRRELFAALGQPGLGGVEFAGLVVRFVEEAGKQASPRRCRARAVIGFAVNFYRQWLRTESGAVMVADSELGEAVTHGRSEHAGVLPDVVYGLDRSLEALGQIDRNANLATLLEAWLADLSLIGERTASFSP